MNLEGLLHYIPNVHASHESENQDLAPSLKMNRENGLVLKSWIPQTAAEVAGPASMTGCQSSSTRNK
jgi:hypothetical protein